MEKRSGQYKTRRRKKLQQVKNKFDEEKLENETKEYKT